jgi:hypothetical protein
MSGQLEELHRGTSIAGSRRAAFVVHGERRCP